MGRAIRLRQFVIAAAALCAAGSAQAQTATQPGVYTEVQAARGDTVFLQVCASCHSTSEFNTPQFRSLWAGKPLFTLFDQLRATMPQDNPGGLTRQQYADVMAYIIKLNGHAAGEVEIPTADDSLRAINFPQNATGPDQRKR